MPYNRVNLIEGEIFIPSSEETEFYYLLYMDSLDNCFGCPEVEEISGLEAPLPLGINLFPQKI